MDDFDCSECGVFCCFESCVEDKREDIHARKLSNARRILSDELKRRNEMHEARELLMDAGVYTPNEYDVLFD